MQDILDIEEILRPFWERHLEAILLVLLCVAALIFLIWFLKKWFAERKLKRIVLPPDEEALKALEQLNRAGWVEKGEFRKYYFALTDILKIYLERRFAFPATDMTTQEMRATLRQAPSSADASAGKQGVRVVGQAQYPDMVSLSNHVLPFFERADLVKFAGLVPEKTVALEDLKKLSLFVAATRPGKEGENV